MPPKQKTKADLKQAVDQLTEKLRAAEARLDVDVEAERDEALERADEAERRVLDLEQEIGQLKKDLEGTTDHVASEVEREVKTRLKRAESDLAGSEEHVRQLELELGDARDEVDRLEWKLESAERDAELQAARVREQAQRDHRKELEARDELIALLKEKLSRQNEPKAMDTEAPPPSSSTGSGCTPDPQHKKETVPVANSGRTVRLSLPTLPTFSGEECRDDEDLFERWVRKLEKYAELESWSDREKLVQLELRLKGRAERLFEVLPSESKSSFKSAVEGLKKRLAPARRDALLSAQLMKRKQLPSESVDQYAQEFETLFDRSYGRRSGMDQESKDLLKRDLFVLGLKMKWQEKVLPSAKTFADSLHQARAAEEQERQLNELHKPQGSSSSAATPSNSADRGSSTSRTGHSSNSSRYPRCRECGSTRHKQRDCPQRRPPSETPARENTRSGSSSAVKAARVTRGEESLDDQCRRLADQLAEAEYQRMSKSYSSNAAVDAVTGSLGPLYYATVTVGGVPVEGMVDPGSSATIMSFNLFQKIGRRAGILKEALKPLDSGLVLRDYSQRPIPIGACVELTFEWGGKSVTSTVFLRSDLGVGGEPCLLGTNVVILLGLMVPGPGVEPRGGDRSPTVCFVQPKRVPGGGAVIVKAKLPNSTPSTDSVFFQPNQRWMADTGLKIEESVVQPDDEGCVHLLVQNPSRDTHKLSIGTPVGQLEPCVEISPGELVNDETNEEPVGLVNRIDDNVQKERVEKLKEMLRVSEEGLTQDEQTRVRDFVLEAHDVFALSELERGEVEGIRHEIDTGDSPPIRQPPRRVPFSLRPTIKGLVDNMLKTKVVQESNSPWSSPVVLVKKKSGEYRFCVDYRALNAVTRKDVFPMPRIDDMLDQLGGKKIFTTLDARSGYWQIKMGSESQEKTAFSTHDGLYEFRVMPFGVCNGPATFQRLMHHALRGFGEFCNVYIDDMIVFSSSVGEHLEHLQLVFDRLREVGVRLHPAKCEFASPKVHYLGHVITAEGILPNPDKVKAVKEFRNPTNVKEVREFLGLAGYYRRFVPNFARVAGPLHSLTRQEVPFHWTRECQQSFDSLKQLLSEPPVLAYPDFARPFTLHTDASGKGLGAVLEQEGEEGKNHPVAYASRTLSKHEKNYGITDLEALGVVWALRHFRAYLLGHACVVVTDHAPLRALLKAKHQSGKLARWGQTIAEFNVEIKYRPGRQHSNADALSRAPLESVNSVQADETTTNTVATDNMASQQRDDPQLKAIIEYLDGGILPTDEKLAKRLVLERSRFTIQDGVLFYVDVARENSLRVAVSSNSQRKLLEEIHGGSLSGHFAARSMYNTLARRY